MTLHISQMKPGNHRNEGREGGRGGREGGREGREGGEEEREGGREGRREEGWSE